MQYQFFKKIYKIGLNFANLSVHLLGLDHKETLLLTENDEFSDFQGCPKIPHATASDLPQNHSPLCFSEHKEGDYNSRVNGKVPLISKNRGPHPDCPASGRGSAGCH